jgi:plasmid maintenance system antidote protein VapI
MVYTAVAQVHEEANVEYTGTYIPAVLRRMDRGNAWLARRMGMSRTYIGQVILGQRRITPAFVERASAALNMPPETLFFVDSRMQLRNHERDAAQVAS